MYVDGSQRSGDIGLLKGSVLGRTVKTDCLKSSYYLYT